MLLQKLSTRNRYFVLVIAILLITVYFVPIWSIRLLAPQYPEGIGMYLWVDKITGMGEFDLRNINLLNHYIGMEPIIEKSIPELIYMPYILGFMILGAVVTFLFPRFFLVVLGLINLAAVGTAGLYDFWRWEYNYGHNLNPDAPISIPGMTYQPPLIGCKRLLNIDACSWPHIGGVALFLSGIILGCVVFSEWRRKRHVQILQ